MNAFKVDLQALVSKHVAAAPTARMLKLVETLADDRDNTISTAPSEVKGIARFVNLDADGMPTDGDHISVYDRKTKLLWLAAPVDNGKEFEHSEAIKAASAVECMGFTDWRAPTIEEQLSIVDYTRCDPAVDTRHFKAPYGWTWTSTPAASPSGYAWFVSLYYGYSNRYLMRTHSHVRAVRAGQQFGFLD